MLHCKDMIHGSESTQWADNRHYLSIYMKYTPYLWFTWRHMQMVTYLQMMLGQGKVIACCGNYSGRGRLYAQQGWDVPSLRTHTCEPDTPRLRHCHQPKATAATQCCSWPSQVAEIPPTGSLCTLSISGLVEPLHTAEQNSWRGLYFLDWPQ